MEAKHTKGPWDHASNLGCKRIFTTALPEDQPDGRNNDVADTVGLFNEVEDTANAHLIAAAPTLLAACEAARSVMLELADRPEIVNLDMWNKGGPGYEAHERVKTAIAEARPQ